MDIFQHTWGQIGLIVLIQLLYLEISTVDCFAWHSPNQARSQTIPSETHIISQRWHQSVPKWYPYNLWRRRKRKESGSRNLMTDISNVKRHLALNGKFGNFVSKYEKLLNKLNRNKHMNSILRNDKWKHEGQSTIFGATFHDPKSSPVASTANALEANDYLSRKHKSHFGNIGSVQGIFSSMKHVDETAAEEKKKVKDSKDSGFDHEGFGKTMSDGFGREDGFKPTKSDDSFSDGFLSAGRIQNEADTAVQTSVGFESDPSGSWGESSFSDSGSWGGDGFGAVDAGATDTSSWGDVPQGSDGFATIGSGSFLVDNKDCDTILTKSCSDNSECSCSGFYTCSNQRCAALQSTGTESSSSGMGGQWGEEPMNFGFSKRRDPSKVVQIFMLPWKPQK